MATPFWAAGTGFALPCLSPAAVLESAWGMENANLKPAPCANRRFEPLAGLYADRLVAGQQSGSGENMTRMFRIACLVLAALAALLALPRTDVLAANAGDPLYAVSQAQRAIDKQDMALFESVVDIDRMLSSASRESATVLASMQQGGDMPALPPALGLALAGLGGGNPRAVDMFSSLLASEARKFIAIGITDGFFAGKTQKNKSNKDKFPILFKGVSTARKELKPGKILENDGNAARVSTTLVDAEAGAIPLELGLSRDGGNWKIVKLDNISELVKQTVAGKKNK